MRNHSKPSNDRIMITICETSNVEKRCEKSEGGWSNDRHLSKRIMSVTSVFFFLLIIAVVFRLFCISLESFVFANCTISLSANSMFMQRIFYEILPKFNFLVSIFIFWCEVFFLLLFLPTHRIECATHCVRMMNSFKFCYTTDSQYAITKI